jgi:alpha-glucosidase
MLALPGGVYLYQGEELGLPEVEDLPDHEREDPIQVRSGGADPGRDGCRVPLPWEAHGPTYGFGPDGGADPWLPQPADWAGLSVAAQDGDPDSTLNLYRAALRLRREHLLDAGPLDWLDTPSGVLAFRRGPVTCWLNTGDAPVALPEGRLLLGSAPDMDGRSLPVDAAAWVKTS